MTVTANGRTAEHDVDPIFLQRWSPRALTGESMPHEALMSLFEAARWAPSAFNGQPWRFVYAHRDTPAWDDLYRLLVPFNQAWAQRASALVYVISDRLRRTPGQPPAPVRTHAFDTGAAWANLALQAARMGWVTHGMAGFDLARSYEVLGIDPEGYEVHAAVAIGRLGDPAILDEAYRAREVPSGRKDFAEFVFEGRLAGG